MDYLIIVNDNGEMKKISAKELENWYQMENPEGDLLALLEGVMDRLLDERSAAEERAELEQDDRREGEEN